jgi:hypothetical protein
VSRCKEVKTKIERMNERNKKRLSHIVEALPFLKHPVLATDLGSGNRASLCRWL